MNCERTNKARTKLTINRYQNPMNSMHTQSHIRVLTMLIDSTLAKQERNKKEIHSCFFLSLSLSPQVWLYTPSWLPWCRKDQNRMNTWYRFISKLFASIIKCVKYCCHTFRILNILFSLLFVSFFPSFFSRRERNPSRIILFKEKHINETMASGHKCFVFSAIDSLSLLVYLLIHTHTSKAREDDREGGGEEPGKKCNEIIRVS